MFAITGREQAPLRLVCDRVVVMENHDQAYHEWRAADVRERALVHVDAHHDMWWLPDNAAVSIANFICPAIKDGLVSRMFWVVPDATFQTAEGRRTVARFLKLIARKYQGRSSVPTIGDREVSAIVGGIPVTVCTIDTLPAIDEPVLLDLDVDFMVIPHVTWGGTDQHSRLPWCWPEDLLVRLAAAGVETDLVTVAYSVEGGFTPLRWKYLGDELAARLSPSGNDASTIEGFSLMRSAAEALESHDIPPGQFMLERAAKLVPCRAACWHRLGLLHLEAGRVERARAAYRRALDLDSSYATPFASRGFALYGDRQFEGAKREHLETLALHPDSAYAHLGLGQVCAASKNWEQAEQLLRRALALDDGLIDAYRELANVLTRLCRIADAIACYERSLRLGLTGSRPVTGPFLTKTSDPRVLDPDHARVYEQVGRLYQRLGETTRAFQAYEMSVAGGNDGAAIRLRLAGLCARQRRFRRALGHLYRAPALIPTALGTLVHVMRQRVLHAYASLVASRMRMAAAEPS